MNKISSKIGRPNVNKFWGMEPDMYGRKKTVIDPSSGVMTFNTTYSSDGTKKTIVTDANNKEITSTYDKYGLLVNFCELLI